MMLAAGPPSPPSPPSPTPPGPGRARAAVLLGLLTALVAAAWVPSVLRARREGAPPGTLALCGFGETCRTIGCHFTFPFGSPTLSWELRQATPDAPLPAYWSPGQALELKLAASDLDAYYMGFQIAAVTNCPFAENGGTIELLEPARTAITVGDFDLEYLTHSCTCLDIYDCCGFVPEVLASGEFAWTFRWTPPPRGAGPVTFHLALNSANGDGSPDNDRISIGELLLLEEPCPPPIDDLRVRKASCDPMAPAEPRLELWRSGGGAIEFIREAGDVMELGLPVEAWALVPTTCRPLDDGRSLVAWSLAPSCDLGGEGLH